MELVVPPRIVLTPESFEAVVRMIENPAPPTAAMKALMAGETVAGLAVLTAP